MRDHNKGVYGKYIIQKSNGEAIDPQADYFVLRLDTDPAARRAALRYAQECEETAPELAADLRARIEKYEPKLAGDSLCQKKHLREILNLLAELIDSWNDAAADGDRGRDNGALCLVIWDDGSGQFGVVHDNPLMNVHNEFDDLDVLTEYLNGWLRLEVKERDGVFML